ncbi:MAG: SLC13 family permease [Alphaproteobacteria bacterium]|nr:SLC13 family permease [Alphaproteobacteria bacterium]NCQ88129.1 SLC13 family permease [Alphaproteobacteria bacterium]NCT05364.1 SLC13 family permease [Alphaproteobacteria bacterium]
MWFVLAITALAVYFFAREKYPLEVTSVAILTALLLFGQIFPVPDANGRNLLDAYYLLAGFANPALLAVLALLVMGQAIIRTDSLRPMINIFVKAKFLPPWASIVAILLFVLMSSAFLNNTPLVILAIPIMQAIGISAGVSPSKIMMPLSFAAILGGMMTLVGSSTNLLVSSAMVAQGYEALGFFDFLIPGMILAGVGLIYLVTILPLLMPNRQSLTQELSGNAKEFVAELDVTEGSVLIGMECVNGRFLLLPELNIRLIQRQGHLILPPFEGYLLEKGDILIAAATRDALADVLSKYPGFLLSEEEVRAIDEKEQEHQDDPDGIAKTVDLEDTVAETRILAELMIPPASRFVDMTIDQVDFLRQFGTIVLGIQRRARVVRRRLGRIRLEPGDVLLVAGAQGEINAMRQDNTTDVIVLSGSKKELPLPKKAPIAGLIFLATVILASTGVLSIAVAAITGAVALIATGCLNIRQATRAIDRKILLLVGAMLALGVALQATGGAQFIAELLLKVPFADQPLFMVSLLFILVAFCTNILSNNACAILFTPIAMNMAVNIGADPIIFAIAVIFAANCSFASPIGYQTNLLVMGPGHYRFRDFMKAGIPLVLIIWVTYIAIAKFYYGL